MDVERLKNPNPEFGKDYFDEQLEKITDIYSQCSIDYDKNSSITKNFFATVQNKLHFSITGNTVAEIIKLRANHTRQNMGLTSWKNSPKGRIRRKDVSIAKNYLDEQELKSLNRIVTMYLDYGELQAENKVAMTMEDWVKKLDAFLQFNEKDILQDSGKVSAEIAKAFAESEFDKFRAIQGQGYESDFDEAIKELLKESG